MKTRKEQKKIPNNEEVFGIMQELKEQRAAIASLEERVFEQQEYIKRLEEYALYFMNELLEVQRQRLRELMRKKTDTAGVRDSDTCKCGGSCCGGGVV